MDNIDADIKMSRHECVDEIAKLKALKNFDTWNDEITCTKDDDNHQICGGEGEGEARVRRVTGVHKEAPIEKYPWIVSLRHRATDKKARKSSHPNLKEHPVF